MVVAEAVWSDKCAQEQGPRKRRPGPSDRETRTLRVGIGFKRGTGSKEAGGDRDEQPKAKPEAGGQGQARGSVEVRKDREEVATTERDGVDPGEAMRP